MATVEQRSVIKHFYLKNETLAAIHQELKNCYGDEAPTYSTTKYWFNQFRCGRESAASAHSSGRPLEIDYSAASADIRRLLEEDRKVSIAKLSAWSGLSIGTVFKIVRHDLGLRKYTTRWVPHVLSEANKQARLQCCEAALSAYNKQPEAFLKCIITMDETWVFTYEPETVQEAMEWAESKDQVSKRAKLNHGIKKAMLSIWWDYFGVVYYKFLEDGQTMNGEEFRRQIDEVDRCLRNNRPERPSRKPFLLMDNARPHTARESQQKVKEKNWNVVYHPPYSPDIAPSDYFLFSNLKRHMRGKRFSSIEELKAEVIGYFEEKPQTWYAGGISKLPDRWSRVVALRGDYIA